MTTLDIPGARSARPIVPALGTPTARLLLTSTTVLFVELLLIRWIPANVVYVGYFSNFLLIGSFLGIGIGVIAGGGGWNPRVPIFPLLLFAVVAIVARAQLTLTFSSPSDIYFGLNDQARGADANYLVLPVVVGLTAAVMAAIALPLGPLFRSMPPLRAYAVDVMGSMIGIVLFSGLSALGTTPVAWFAVAAILLAATALGRGVSAWSLVTSACMVGVVVHAAALGDLWSPYQRITISRAADAIGISANGVPHQGFFLDPAHTPYAFYTQLDRWFPGRSWSRVLIIGAGAGNDTAVALTRGATHVDAVEIDPVILDIGRTLNPSRPYDDPRVTATNQDGRAFLRTTTARYDLVIYAVTDSLALVSNTANLRLESYIFTKQAFDEVRDHLAPDGAFVLYNYYREPWLVDKIGGMLTASFGSAPIARLFPSGSGAGAVLAIGPAITALNGQPPPGDRVDPIGSSAVPAPATDDWPFLYLQEPEIASFYLIALAIVLALAVLAVAVTARRRRISMRRFSPHFFVLGMAFLLLETRSIAVFSLLFGTTWIVNSLVFFAILASVLASIAVSSRLRGRWSRWLYFALGSVLLLNLAVPPVALLIDPPWLRYLVAVVLTFAPVFFANLVFASSFRDTRTADMAFASNLLGAVAGGSLEYLALILGYQALLIVVLALYGAALLLATRLRRLADVDLGIDPDPTSRHQPVEA